MPLGSLYAIVWLGGASSLDIHVHACFASWCVLLTMIYMQLFCSWVRRRLLCALVLLIGALEREGESEIKRERGRERERESCRGSLRGGGLFAG